MNFESQSGKNCKWIGTWDSSTSWLAPHSMQGVLISPCGKGCRAQGWRCCDRQVGCQPSGKRDIAHTSVWAARRPRAAPTARQFPLFLEQALRLERRRSALPPLYTSPAYRGGDCSHHDFTPTAGFSEGGERAPCFPSVDVRSSNRTDRQINRHARFFFKYKYIRFSEINYVSVFWFCLLGKTFGRTSKNKHCVTVCACVCVCAIFPFIFNFETYT